MCCVCFVGEAAELQPTQSSKIVESWAVLLSLREGVQSHGFVSSNSQQLWAISQASHRGFIRKHSPSKGAPAYKIGAAETAWDSLLRESTEDEMSQEVLRAGIGALLFGLGDMLSQVCIMARRRQAGALGQIVL